MLLDVSLFFVSPMVLGVFRVFFLFLFARV